MATAGWSRVQWTTLVPPLAVAALVVTWGRQPGAVVLVVVGVLLAGAVFAAVMITVNGVVGLSLLVATIRHGTASFNAEGTASALATVATLTTLSLVLPTFTTTRSGPEFSPGQLAFAAVASFVLYLLFVFVQTVRHREFFVADADREPSPTAAGAGASNSTQPEEYAPTDRQALISVAMLLVALVAVVGLAKIESPAIEDAVDAIGAPPSAVGVVIALLVLLPETIAAVRYAARGRIQTSLNLALGSAMASIGLTIPSIAIATIWLDGPLLLASARSRSCCSHWRSSPAR